MKPGIFLTADWRHLTVLSYRVEPAALEPFVPPGVELDYWNNQTYISLVAFFFERTRVCGWSIPFHRTFPEVNLRFYVKRKAPGNERRGVVFLREIAPRRAIAFIASRFYGEKYLALPMSASIERDQRLNNVACRARFDWRLGRQRYAIEAESNALPRYPEPGSLEEFIIEHYWGYSTGRCDTTDCIEYEVEHPPWMVRPADKASFVGEPAPLYGQRFAEVLSRSPDSAFLANGSAVAVHRGAAVPATATARDAERRKCLFPRGSREPEDWHQSASIRG